MAVQVQVAVAFPWPDDAPLGDDELSETARLAALAALRDLGVRGAELSIAFLDDGAIAAMNETYLGHEGPTDVISFELGDGDGGATVGDIYIGWDQAVRQAAEFGVPIREEVVRLVVHGTLHVCGYDHPEDEERERSPMWRRQEAIVREVVEGWEA
jgi:probable rRNA maturation factor